MQKAAIHLDETTNPFVQPNLVIKTSPTAPYPFTQVRLYRYTSGHWTPFGGLVSVRP